MRHYADQRLAVYGRLRRCAIMIFLSFPGSAWERTAGEALPRAFKWPEASRTPGRQSLPGGAFPGRAWERETRYDARAARYARQPSRIALVAVAPTRVTP